MKTNIAVLTFLICIVMVTTAVKADVLLSTNGDFSGGTHVGNGGHVMPLLWNTWNSVLAGWGNPTAAADYNTGGYVVAKIDGTNATPGGYAVVFQESTTSLAALGIPEGILPFNINFSADINDLIPGGGGPGAILKLECYSDLSGTICTNPNPTSCGDERQIATSGSTWANYMQLFTVPSATKSIKFVIGVSTGWGGPNAKPSSFAFDNLKISLDYYGTPALYPIPIMGGAQNLPNKVISWTNPEGAVNADVYLQASTVPISPSPDPRLTGTRIAHDINAESLTVSSLLVNRYYYWAVDVNMGNYVVSGFTWDFHTTNLNVEAGPTQYLVRTASPKTLILNATVTSDNAIATYAWTNTTVATDKDPYTTVTIVSPATEDTNVTLTNTEPNHTVDGWYQFTLTVTDVQGNIAADNVAVGVYATCAAAAIADPNDYYDGVADFNGDCKVDLADFAIFAGKWLACDLLRRPCP